MPSWLNTHRKADLEDLAGQAGIDDVSDLRKVEIVALLEERLTNHASEYSQLPVFEGYYARKGSPTKREMGSTPAAELDVTKSVTRRRATQIKGESDAEPVSSPTAATGRRAARAVVVRTPARVEAPRIEAAIFDAPRIEEPIFDAPTVGGAMIEDTSLLSPPRMPLPPSPAVVTDTIEEQTARISEGVNKLWNASHIMDMLYDARVGLSSVTGVHTTIFLLELAALHYATVPRNFAFDVPSLFGFPGFAVFLPDLFVLLTHHYWAPSLLWATMNFWAPLAMGWLFNLSLKLKKKDGYEDYRPKYRIDPLMFSIAKALMSWMVYSQGNRLYGTFADETVKTVETAMPYGYSGSMVAAYIGIATSIWDGIQNKK
ncbi:hypothetical protein D6D20_06854 [Aureobasidium pullulans]|uniref:Rho termination factor N-terminal domain-containing protein n=1 Tax=Aureobasidium pullulans TaxID=5580 RepID=A0A4S8Z698_AURPU|nr:hypothetical protein D6D20_06854 [Aureobasidium pullulans]